jgi:hypothetical protein
MDTIMANELHDSTRIKFDWDKIALTREHVPYIRAREIKCLWQITHIGPNGASNWIMATTPI